MFRKIKDVNEQTINTSNSNYAIKLITKCGSSVCHLWVVVHDLDLEKTDKSLARIIRPVEIQVASVSFELSASVNPSILYKIHITFTAHKLNIDKQSCPVNALKQKFVHLRDIPIIPLKEVQPMLLIRSDYPHHTDRASTHGPFGQSCCSQYKFGLGLSRVQLHS